MIGRAYMSVLLSPMRVVGGAKPGTYVTRDVAPEYLASLEASSRTRDRLRPGRQVSLTGANALQLPAPAGTAA